MRWKPEMILDKSLCPKPRVSSVSSDDNCMWLTSNIVARPVTNDRNLKKILDAFRQTLEPIDANFKIKAMFSSLLSFNQSDSNGGGINTITI